MSSDSKNGRGAPDDARAGDDHGSGPLAEGAPEQSKGENTDTYHEREDEPEKVGYGSPPKKYRVRKGQVLNPTGRPKGSKNKPKEPSNSDLRAMILKEARRMIVIKDAGQPLTLMRAEAVRHTQFVSAMKGSVRAQRDYLNLLRLAENDEKCERGGVIISTIEYKLKWQEELNRRKAGFIRGPGPSIHPDNIVLDPESGGISFLEPVTKKEKAALAPWKDRGDELVKELRDLKAQLKEPNCPDRHELLEEIQQARNVLSIIQDALDGSRHAVEVLKAVKIPDEDAGS